MGLPSSEQSLSFNVIDIYRREGDKLAENWIFIDLLYMLAQTRRRRSSQDGQHLSSRDRVMVIDAHHHLWDLNAVRYTWLMERGVKRFFGDPYEHPARLFAG